MGEDEAGTLARLHTHRRELIDPKVAEHKGRIVKTTGDGILIEFPSVVEALACALAVQQGMAERNAAIPENQRVGFRIGIHQGDIIVEGEDIFGDGVNVAARLEGIAEAGGICVSARVQEDTAGRLDVAFDDLGAQTLKNIARPVRVYRVRTEGTAVRTAGPAPSLPDRPSLAVLPFQNMSGDPEQEYFADGVVEEITTAIARFTWLSVIARNSSFTYKGKAFDVREVARDLGVRYVLEGSVRKAGDRVRITGQLIDTATGAHIWADRFDGSLEDVFDLQDQVAVSVAGAIAPRLRLAEIDRARRKPTESLDAYDLYLRAVAENYKRTREGHDAAVRLLQQALALDPAYVPVMARIAVARHFQLVRGWIRAGAPEIGEAVRLARRALAEARDDPDVLELAGWALAGLANENETGLSAIDQAIALNPSLALAFGHRALVLIRLDRPEEAIAAAQQAMRLSPQDPAAFVFHQALAFAGLATGRYEEGFLWADRAVRENGGIVALRLKLALCGHLGRVEEAKECLYRLREIDPEPTIAPVRRIAFSPTATAQMIEGLRKAGLPEG
jgi:TolB-like protein